MGRAAIARYAKQRAVICGLMDFITAIRAGLYRALDFEGRARRSEFWFFILFGMICVMTAISLDSALGTPKLGIMPDHGLPEDYKQSLFYTFRASNYMIESVVGLALFIPLFSVMVRRLHDVGLPGYWAIAYYALGFVSGPTVGEMMKMVEAGEPEIANGFMMLIAVANLAAFAAFAIFALRDSDKGPNQYGASPKY